MHIHGLPLMALFDQQLVFGLGSTAFDWLGQSVVNIHCMSLLSSLVFACDQLDTRQVTVSPGEVSLALSLMPPSCLYTVSNRCLLPNLFGLSLFTV